MNRAHIFAGSILLLLLGLSQPAAANAPPTLSLPFGALNQASMPGVTVSLSPLYSPTYVQFLATFDSIPTGYSIGNSTYTGWCADPFSEFASNPPYNLISTYDTVTLNNPPGGGRAQNPNWSAINWVLNNKPTTGNAPTWIVQQVIWKLLTGHFIAYAPGGGYYPAPAPAPLPLSAGDSTVANSLYATAIAQDTFVPGPGQVVGVMLYTDGINPDGTSTISNSVVSQNNINPLVPPLNGLNGQPNRMQEIVIEVTVAGPAVTCSATNSGEVGVAFNSPAITVLGGAAPYTFSVATRTLPAGLTLNSSTGAITGTPTAAGTFTIQAIDANGFVGTGGCPFTIIAGPSLTCSAVNSGEVGVPLISPALTVNGGTAPYTFSIATGSLPMGLTLNASTGAITGTPTAPGTFTIKVTDANGAVATGTCPFTIIAGPSLTCSAVSSGEVGVPLISPALTVNGGTAPYTFAIATGSLPMGLTLNASTGAITGTPTAPGTFTIKVTDANGAVATGTCPFTIIAGPSLTCSAVSSGEVGVPFSIPALTVNGGTAPYTFSIATGSLPMGLTLNASTGAITGTPTAPGIFTIKVTDANGAVATGTCPFTIIAGPSLTCSAVSSGEVGVPLISPALTVNGGTAPYTFAIATGSLPMGLTLNASTGAITGTPTAPGTFTIKVTDANGVVATGTCPFTIIAGPSLTCSAVSSGEVGVPLISPALTVNGGTAPYTFSIATGSLPMGLTLNASTGAITGTPTAPGTFTIKVTDANGAVATGTCPFTIIAGPSLTCSAVSSGEVGVPFSIPALTVNGGTAPYTFSIATGSLPMGLTLNASTGAITGTPTAPGTFTIKVTDANGVVATGTCPFTIIAGPSLTCSAVSSGEVGVPLISPALTVNGGTAPYIFSIVGTLPPGLTLNTATGAITGTPTAPGTFSIKVTDANGATATNCTITINPPLVIVCQAINTGDLGVPFNSGPMTVTGGTAPYIFSIGSGTLPAGLTLNTSTGAVTGTPTASGTFTVMVTDSKGATGTGCLITINPPLTVTCFATNTGTVGVPFNSGPMPVTGGTAPYTFSIGSGALPAGLTLNTSTGAITGTPTASGTFTVIVKDSLGATGTGCTITISNTSVCSTGLVPISYNLSENSNNVNEIVWFNSHFKLQGTIPTSTFQVTVTNGTITFGPSTLTVPNGVITFSSSASCASTIFDTTLNQWETTLPLSAASKADEIFVAGLAYILPAGFPQNVHSLTWTADFSTTVSGLSVQWKWGAANYLTSDNKGNIFPLTGGLPDYNAMMIDPAHNVATCAGYNSGDHAGTPENRTVKNLVTGGGSGGGGSNWTGSWSSTNTTAMMCSTGGVSP